MDCSHHRDYTQKGMSILCSTTARFYTTGERTIHLVVTAGCSPLDRISGHLSLRIFQTMSKMLSTWTTTVRSSLENGSFSNSLGSFLITSSHKDPSALCRI